MKNRYKLLLGILVIAGVIGIYASQVSAAPTTVVFTSNGTWVAPAGVTVIQVNGWGGGAGGRGTTNDSSGAGGGGAYAGLNAFSVTPGNSYSIVVGIGGALNTNGGTTTFNGSSLVAAPGWIGITNGAGGLGGAIASSTGDVLHAGGNGGAGSSGNHGGGGGGGGGTTADGSNGTAATNTCTVTPTGGAGGTSLGGAGGNGATNAAASTAGTAPGGGGGGGATNFNCSTNRASSAGAGGEIDITYTLPQISAKVVIATSKVIIGNSKVVIR